MAVAIITTYEHPNIHFPALLPHICTLAIRYDLCYNPGRPKKSLWIVGRYDTMTSTSGRKHTTG